MKFTETELKGAFIVELLPFEDERGFFARSFCEEEFKEAGLCSRVVQSNLSYNKKKGTLRGMHYQVAPNAEAKLVSCTWGRVFDVIVDLRPDSSTYCKWLSIELYERSREMIYIPEGFAHGFQTLTDDAVVSYQMFAAYHPESARGVRWDSPAFGIKWPIDATIISERDSNYSSFVVA